jgi:hypothetical protein
LNKSVVIVHAGSEMTQLMARDYCDIKNIEFIDLSDISILERIFRRFSYKLFPNFWVGRIFRNYRKDDDLTIVLFDSIITNHLCKFIVRHLSKCDVRFWLWNKLANSVVGYIKESGCKVYSFDEGQCNAHNLKYHSQFLPYNKRLLHNESERDYEGIVFIGADKGRLSQINIIADRFKSLNLKFTFMVKSDSSTSATFATTSNIHKINSPLSYLEVINKYKSSLAILDLNKEGQEGLTLRPIECLFMKKKLITNNTNIKKYNFYHKNNIFVISDDFNNDDFVEFIDSSFIDVSCDFEFEYEFSHWLNFVTD